MALFDLFGGRRSSNEPEDRLWAMDKREEEDAAYHARMDAIRWSVTIRLVRELQGTARQVRTILLIILALLAVNTSPQLAGLLTGLLRSLLGL